MELKETVVLSVGVTLQKQLKSYSEAVQGQSLNGSGNMLNQSILKSVVKDVVAEEDRSRNLLIFGILEESVEQIMELNRCWVIWKRNRH